MSKEDVFVIGDTYYQNNSLYWIRGVSVDENGEVMVTYKVLSLGLHKAFWHDGHLSVDEFDISEMRHLPDLNWTEVKPLKTVEFEGDVCVVSRELQPPQGELQTAWIPGRVAVTIAGPINAVWGCPFLVEDGKLVAHSCSLDDALLWVACGIRPLDIKTWA